MNYKETKIHRYKQHKLSFAQIVELNLSEMERKSQCDAHKNEKQKKTKTEYQMEDFAIKRYTKQKHAKQNSEK